MTACPYCGTDTHDPGGPSDDYMYVGHMIFDCREIPDMAHEWFNKPWVRSKRRYRWFMRLHLKWPFRRWFTA